MKNKIFLFYSYSAVGIYAHTASEISALKQYCEILHWDERYGCEKVKPAAALNIINLLLCAVSVVISGAAIYFVHKTPQAASVDA